MLSDRSRNVPCYRAFLKQVSRLRALGRPFHPLEYNPAAESLSSSLRDSCQGRILRNDPNNPGKKAVLYVVKARDTVDEKLVEQTQEALTRLH